MKHYYIIAIPAIFSALLTHECSFAEARRVATWGVPRRRTRNKSQKELTQTASQKSSLRLQQQTQYFFAPPVFPNILSQRTTKTPRVKSPKTSSTTTTTTEIADLANCFQNALVAANRNDHEIHVGNLLVASERLESTMRRIGLNQSANDIANNLAKIRAVHGKMLSSSSSSSSSSSTSMASLLQYEINYCGLDKKKKKERLPELSAACGFLWLGRSLHYQYDMFQHMLHHETADPYEAASVAYERDLRPHLSWPLQKLCRAALATTLKNQRREDMFAKIGGFSEDAYGEREDEATKTDLRQMMDSLKPMLCRWRKVFSDLELGLL